LVYPNVAGTQEASLAEQRAGPAVAEPEPVVCRWDLGQTALQHSVSADGVEGVAHVDLQHYIILDTAGVPGLDIALQAHAHHLRGIAHANAALARL
jgi:hypothetical protein